MIRLLLLTIAAFAMTAAPVRADLVYFQSGRAISVASHREEQGQIVLALRSGGEMIVDRAAIVDIRPDEVPYPEPIAPAAPLAVAPPAAGASPQLRPTSEFDAIISRVARTHGVDSTLVRAVIQVESAYQPDARSRKGAVGLMQVMPATGRQYGIRRLYDPALNIEAGVRHLKSLLARYPLALALAAYNAGEGAVARFRGVPPYPETQSYVSRIMALVGA
jgi:soluble lytic murein transglycosylase-like protein